MSSEPANIDWPVDLPWLATDWRLLRQRFNGQQAPPHALMLTGTPGSGRTATANHIATWLLCQQAQEDAACGTCASCRMYQAGSHPDLLQVKLEEDANTIKVDQIRALIHALNLTAGFNGWRVAIIQAASSMTDSAANALLKTLEEPGDKTLLLLLADTRMSLPATIHSRCQQCLLQAPAREVALAWLQQHFSDDEQVLAQALDMAYGAPLQAWSLLRQDHVATARSIAAGLQSLAAADADTQSVLDQWQPWPAEQCWHWIQFWLHQWSRQCLADQHVDAAARQALLQLYDQAAESAQTVASGLRQELQINAWLLRWQGMCASHAIMQRIST